MTAAVAVQSPGVQRRLATQLLERISGDANTVFSFSDVSIQAPGTVGVRDLLILDKTPYKPGLDTILFVKDARASVSAGMLISKKGLHLRRADVNGAYGTLIMEPDGVFKTNVARVLGQVPRGDTVLHSPVIVIDRIHAEDVNFRMQSFRERSFSNPGRGMDYADLEAHAEYLDAHGFNIRDGFVSATLDEAHLTEKSGLDAILSGKVKAGAMTTELRNLHLDDGYSDLHIPMFFMGADYRYAFRNFSEHVRMKLKVGHSTLASQTLTALANGILPDNRFLLEIDNADAQGYVSDLKLNELRFKDLIGGTSASIKASATGLTISNNMLLDAKVDRLRFTTAGLEKTLGAMIPGSRIRLAQYARGRTLEFSGSASGPLDRLSANGKLRSGRGTLDARLNLRNILAKDRTREISGRIGTKRLDVGNIIGKDLIGEVSASTGFQANITSSDLNVRVDSLMVDKLGLLGYDYTGIAAAGVYSDDSFDGKIICADPNLNFIFQGLFNLSPKTRNALYKFSANVGYADLEALHLDTRGGTSKVSGRVNANFMKIPRGDLLGDISLLDITLENDNGVKYIGDIQAGSHSNGGTTRAQINSSFLDAGYVGNRSMLDLWDDLQAMSTRRELPALYSRHDAPKGNANGKYDISVNFHDSRDLLSFLKPGVYIADSTSIELKADGKGLLKGSVRSPRLAYLANYMKGLDIEFDNMGGSANAILLTDEMRLGNVGLMNSALTAFAQQNEFFTSFHYDNIEGIDNMGEIYLSGNLQRSAGDTLAINAKPLSSYVKFEDSQWDLAESDISFRDGELRFRDFLLYNGAQTLAINGGISRNRKDTLTLNLSNIDAAIVNYFTKRDVELGGTVNGKALLTSSDERGMKFLLNMSCDSLRVGGSDAGALRMAAAWDKDSGRISTFAREVMDGYDAMNLRASYTPGDKLLDLDARLENFNLAMFSPFVPEAVSVSDGKLHGQFRAQGSLDTLAISSSGARIEDGKVKVGYTGVSYRLGGPFRLDRNELAFDNFNIIDDEGGHAYLNGGVRFEDLSDFNIGASLRLNNLKVIGNAMAAGPVYGDLYASGNVSASGPFDAILLDADLYTTKAGDLHVALGGASSAAVGNLLTFTDHTVLREDPYEAMLNEFLQQESTAKKSSRIGLVARARVNTTPDLEAVLELDNTGSNVLMARGSGLLNINIEPGRNIFDVGGDYNISSGKYNFAIPGITSRSFNINSGSSIKFGGNLLDSELDINATYSLRTSINKLMAADSSSVATRRIVNCGIGISDKLSSPKLSFSITIPDLDPTTKAEVESALNTEDKVQKQFLSLLIAGSFLQNEETGIVNNSTMVFSNVSELMSSQLSNLLNRMDIPVDLGVGYQQNSSGTDLYDVSLSTELFDSRVEVHGSVGNRMYSNTTNPNGDVVGDIDIDVKLDRPGQLRLNMFSHSADEYTSYLDFSQRNGVGITYQKEFTRLRRKRDKDGNVVRDEEKRTIVIEADE